MTRVVLGGNQYGKAETHVVRITKSGPEKAIHDINNRDA